ncbi:MAG: hypothetical protein NVSMB16_12470 [Acidimicrobiales bacterium]
MLCVIGLLLIVGGGFGLIRGFGSFAGLPADEPILSDTTRAWVAHHHGAFWAAVAVAALVVSLLGVVWLRQQLRGALPANQDLARHDDESGTTRVRSGDAATALADEIGSWPGVEDASARLLGDPDRPVVLVRVGVAADADFAEVCRRVDAEALPGLRQCLELDHLDADLELRIRPREGRVVH